MTLTGYTTWAQLKLEPKIHVLSTAFSPDGEILAGGSACGTVRLWNPNTGEQEATLDHESPVLIIAFSPNGDVLASANVNGTVRLWDPYTRRVRALLGHGSPVTTVAFGRDKHSVITGSRDGQTHQWEVWDVTDSAPEILTASTASPLTESTIHGSVVTLTLNRLAYAPARGIRDPVKVSGIAGETVDTSNIWRVNDTELTVELEFNGGRCHHRIQRFSPYCAATGHGVHGIGNCLDHVSVNGSRRWRAAS